MNILLLCDIPTPDSNASALAHHVESIASKSKNNIYVLSNLGDLPAAIELEWFDALVIHYSIYILGDGYITEKAREQIAHYSGLKGFFIQDEYRTINQFQSMIDRLGIDVLFSCMPPDLQSYIYPKHVLPNLRIEQVLTGYVTESMLGRASPAIAVRPIDVGYRGRTLGYWYGKVAVEKSMIGERFLGALQTPLNTDIKAKENDRIYGQAWIEFMESCKVVLGVESAVSILDFTGQVQKRTEQYMQLHPAASFEEVEAACFPGKDNQFYTGQISPRCFEAAALRTAMVLFEGDYSGALIAGRHYIPLDKEFKNMADVEAALKDTDKLQEMVDRTYEEVALNPRWSYQAMVDIFDRAMDEEFAARKSTHLLHRKRRTLDAQQFFEVCALTDRRYIGRRHGSYMVKLAGEVHYAGARSEPSKTKEEPITHTSTRLYAKFLPIFMALPFLIRAPVVTMVYKYRHISYKARQLQSLLSQQWWYFRYYRLCLLQKFIHTRLRPLVCRAYRISRFFYRVLPLRLRKRLWHSIHHVIIYLRHTFGYY